MNALSKLIAIAALATAATSPALAQVVNGKEVGSCPSVEDNDKMSMKLQLAALDMMSIRGYLKRAGQQPEKIGSSEAELKALEDVIAATRAKLSLCDVKSALSTVTLQ